MINMPYIKVLNNIFNTKNYNNDKLNMSSYLMAIDSKNRKKVEILFKKNNKNNIGKDFVFEMYNNNQLNCERLTFIIENCTKYLNISSCLINTLMKNNNKELLELLFEKHLKFFDNEFILSLLIYYKNQIPLSNTGLYQKVNSEKYKISVVLNENFFVHNRSSNGNEIIGLYDSSYYLFNACKSRNEFAVKFLLEHGADLNKEDSFGETPLFVACRNGDESIVKCLVEHGADINKEKNDGKTPLFNACESGNEAIIKYLVEHGADINKESYYGFTPILIACENGNELIVKYLVEHGADVNKEKINGKTPLFNACYGGNEAIVKYLVEHGANINKEDHYGKTPLFNPCKNGNKSIVKYLVECGADINHKNKVGATPLSYACLGRKKTIVRYLMEQGADFNKKAKLLKPIFNI